MSTPIRLPSFNDFSPGIMSDDLRTCLRAIKAHGPNDDRVIDQWVADFFGGKKNKRATTNIPATLTNTGLATTSPLQLTTFGEDVLAAPSAQKAAKIFCAKIIREKNGDKLIIAIANLNSRKEKVTKDSLKKELVTLGVTNLSTATTDHTTLRNWMVVAGYLGDESTEFAPNNAVLKKEFGITTAVIDSLMALTPAQRVLLLTAKRRAIGGTGMLPTSPLIKECLRLHPRLFDDDQIRKQVIDPLEAEGWLSTAGVSVSGHGGKSGSIKLTKKTLSLSERYLLPSIDDGIPADLRRKLNTPLSDISSDLASSNKHKRGLALELLALRMLMDLGLDPKGFRTRSADTAFAEVDLIAEGAHLLFSRWTVQCKNVGSKVPLSAVAKEVGIAVYSRAHVVMVVTTSGFSKDALEYAKEVSRSTHLQFLFVTGKQVRDYLKLGVDSLLEHVFENARHVMQEKSSQPTGKDLPPGNGDTGGLPSP